VLSDSTHPLHLPGGEAHNQNKNNPASLDTNPYLCAFAANADTVFTHPKMSVQRRDEDEDAHTSVGYPTVINYDADGPIPLSEIHHRNADAARHAALLAAEDERQKMATAQQQQAFGFPQSANMQAPFQMFPGQHPGMPFAPPFGMHQQMQPGFFPPPGMHPANFMQPNFG
jgi:hypothetical protein